MASVKAKKFCGCIKKVSATVKARKGSTKEGSAIAICTSRMLQTKGRTLKRFSCTKKGGPMLKTQVFKRR